MTEQTIGFVFVGGLFILLAFWAGQFIGGARQRDMWRDHMAKCNQYISAVDDLDRWCGHTSPHAKVIARHLKARGEGRGYNGGTPHADEACDVSGLRQQLKTLDASIAQKKEHPHV